MKYLVTGGAGFIGSHLVHRLLKDGHDVRAVDDLSTGSRENLPKDADKFAFFHGDIRQASSLAVAMEGVDAVFHLAALASVQRSVANPILTNEVNIHGTLMVLEQAMHAKVKRFVFASSSSVYGNTPILPKQENMLPNPLSPYAIQKMTGEKYCKYFHDCHGLETFALRFFNVYGPRQSSQNNYAAVVPKFITALMKGVAPVIYGTGQQTRDFTFVGDVVSACLACVDADEKSSGEVYNIAGGREVSVSELLETIEKATGVTDIAPNHVGMPYGEVLHSKADTGKAEKALRWKSKVSLSQGISQAVEWYKGAR